VRDLSHRSTPLRSSGSHGLVVCFLIAGCRLLLSILDAATRWLSIYLITFWSIELNLILTWTMALTLFCVATYAGDNRTRNLLYYLSKRPPFSPRRCGRWHRQQAEQPFSLFVEWVRAVITEYTRVDY